MEKKKHIIASEKQTLATLIQEATDNAKMEFFNNPSMFNTINLNFTKEVAELSDGKIKLSLVNKNNTLKVNFSGWSLFEQVNAGTTTQRCRKPEVVGAVICKTFGCDVPSELSCPKPSKRARKTVAKQTVKPQSVDTVIKAMVALIMSDIDKDSDFNVLRDAGIVPNISVEFGALTNNVVSYSYSDRAVTLMSEDVMTYVVTMEHKTMQEVRITIAQKLQIMLYGAAVDPTTKSKLSSVIKINPNEDVTSCINVVVEDLLAQEYGDGIDVCNIVPPSVGDEEALRKFNENVSIALDVYQESVSSETTLEVERDVQQLVVDAGAKSGITLVNKDNLRQYLDSTNISKIDAMLETYGCNKRIAV